MATPNESKLQKQVDKLLTQVNSLSDSNSRLLDAVADLKSNYTRLVEDVSTRFEVVHKKLFR